MSKKNHSKSGIFLIELLLAIAIFSVCAAICIHIISVANTERRYSENLAEAVNIATSCADSYKSGMDLSEIKKRMLTTAENFNCSLTETTEDGTKVLIIKVSDNDHEYIEIKAAQKGALTNG